MNTEDVLAIVQSVLGAEYASWTSSSDTYTGQRAVQSVAQRIARKMYPDDELRQRVFVEQAGCAT